MDEKSDERPSFNLFIIVIVVLVLSTISILLFYRYRNTKPVNPFSKIYKLTPSDVTTAAGAAQSFTATYSDDKGWKNISDATLYITDGKHDQWLHYNPATNSFSSGQVKGNCKPGQAATLSSSFLTLNCGASSASGAGDKPTVTFSLTPDRSFSGSQYRLIIIAFNQDKASSGAIAGNWTVK